MPTVLQPTPAAAGESTSVSVLAPHRPSAVATPRVVYDFPTGWSVADLQRYLGDIPAERIILSPTPGTASKEMLESLNVEHDILCELIDGILVRKTMGIEESRVASALSYYLHVYLEQHNFGMASTADGLYEIVRDQVRGPDVAFTSWRRLATLTEAHAPIPLVAPDLVCEILSRSNRAGEMSRKLQDYFAAGVRLVWYIDPETRSARIYERVDEGTPISEQESLPGGDVLPGFELKLADLFRRAWPKPPQETES